MGGKGMPQCMRRCPLAETKGASQPLHQALRLARAHRFASLRQKEWARWAAAKRDLVGIIFDRIAHDWQHGNCALLATLPENGECGCQWDIAPLQPQRLGNA